MKRKVIINLSIMSIGIFFALTSCSSDNDLVTDNTTDTGNSASSSYFFTATNSEESANYIATVDSLSQGSSTIVGNGLETYTGTEWFTWNDKYLFRLQYNQGNNGGTSSYYLNGDKEITNMPNTYDIQRFTTYGIYGKYVITAASAATDTKDTYGNAAYGISVTYLNPEAGTTTTREAIMAENLLGNGEYVTMSGIVEAGNKLYSAIIPIGLSAYGTADGNGKWVKSGNEDLLVASTDGATKTLSGTQYPDSCWVVVYDNEQMENPTFIRTDKMSYACGRMRSQYYQTIWPDADNNIYVFSPGFARTTSDTRQQTTLQMLEHDCRLFPTSTLQQRNEQPRHRSQRISHISRQHKENHRNKRTTFY